MIDPTIFVFILVIVLGTIAIRLGHDPVWFVILCGVGGVAVYLMNLAPIHLSWWIIPKFYGG